MIGTDSAGDTVVEAAVASSAGVRAEGCADSGTTCGLPCDADVRVLFTVGLARCPFFGVFFARAPFSAPMSADTSNVQRTRRPARRGGILIACFDTVNL